MKQSLLFFLSVFLLTATANTAQAFDKKDLAKLKETKKCVKCDLSGADLKGATWPNHRKCKKGSIGKCN